MKYLTWCFALLVPAVLITVSIFWIEGQWLPLVFPIPYVLTIAGIVFVVKRKLFNVWLLPVSFMLSPLPIVFFDAALNHGSCMRWFGTLLITFFYALPFFVIALIVAVVVSKRKQIEPDLRNRKEQSK